jgi:hypothetical protein
LIDATVTRIGAELSAQPRAECSRDRPWGIHGAMTKPACPRCGWTPRERPVA